MFNIIFVLIFLLFINFIIKLVIKFVFDRVGDIDEDEIKIIKYIDDRMIEIFFIVFVNMIKEVFCMGEKVKESLNVFMEVLVEYLIEKIDKIYRWERLINDL